jgi:phosphoenolpyruvate synthase/pyruvate phosphate dikinase
MIGSRDYADIGYKYHLTVPEGELGNSQWFDKNEHQEIAKQILEKIKVSKTFSHELVADCNNRCDSLLNISKKINKMKFGVLTNEQLFKIFSEWIDAYLKLVRHMYTPHIIELALTKEITEWLNQKLKTLSKEEKIEQYLGVILISKKETFATQEQKELLKIAEKAKKLSDTEVDELLESHAKKWSWMPMVNIGNKPRDKNSFKAVFNSLKESGKPKDKLVEIENQRNRQIKEMQNLLQELTPPDNIKRMIETLQEFIFLRTYRMDIYGQSNYFIQPFLNEIASRASLATVELLYLTHLEVLEFLKGRQIPPKDEIKRRMSAFGFSIKNGIISPILSGDDAHKLKKIELKEEESGTILKGNVASRGVAMGKVKIILSVKDIGKIEKGDILVAKMTTPDMTVGLGKASAIVTDEGGITSHAAIVSREFGIPCIVGTHNATKVLKDGDFIRVDAEKGTIEVIK